MNSTWWITDIDWRLSSGVIFFVLLLLFGRGEKRSHYAWRVAASGLVLIGGSWSMRFIIEEVLHTLFASALGYTLFIVIMSMLYLLTYWFCRKTSVSEYLFNSTLALTVYRLAWDAMKMITNGMMNYQLPWPIVSLYQSLFSYGIYLLISVLCYLFYLRIAKDRCRLHVKMMSWLFLIVLVCQMLLEFSYRITGSGNSAQYLFLFFFTSFMYSMMSFALLLMLPYLDRLQQDKTRMENFINSKTKYYEISSTGILSLQTKCHDLKHQIKLIRSAEGKMQFDQYIDHLEESINEYNTVVETGNKSLDIVLTEKNIICQSKGIKFSYILDGTIFNFLSEMDIYALFGNIMDNAIESIDHISNRECSYITMKAARQNGLVILFTENYFENELKYKQGKLITNKKEKQLHGFGLRSISAIAKKYGGLLSIQAENQVFKLTVTLAEPPKTEDAAS